MIDAPLEQGSEGYHLSSRVSKIAIQSDSETVERLVRSSIESLPVTFVSAGASDVDLHLIHLTEPHARVTDRTYAAPVILIGPAKTAINHAAIATSLPYPFLSNQLRVAVGKVLGISIPDSEVYAGVDRPIPIKVNKLAQTTAVDDFTALTSSPPTSSEFKTPNSLSSVSSTEIELPAFERPAPSDLPQVSDSEFVESGLHKIPETVVPKAVEPIQRELGLSTTQIEQMSEAYLEKVIWEVVPKLAEKILREEITRMLREPSKRNS